MEIAEAVNQVSQPFLQASTAHPVRCSEGMRCLWTTSRSSDRTSCCHSQCSTWEGQTALVERERDRRPWVERDRQPWWRGRGKGCPDGERQVALVERGRDRGPGGQYAILYQ